MFFLNCSAGPLRLTEDFLSPPGQINELTEKIATYDREVRELIASAKAARERKRHGESDDEDDEEEQRGQASHPEAAEGGEDDDDDDDSFSDTSNDEFEDRFVDLEEDLANVIADVHDLGQSVERSFFRRSRLLIIIVDRRPLLSLELHRIRQDRQETRRE